MENKQQKYLVTLEGLVPVVLQYEVSAENQEEAFKKVDKQWMHQGLVQLPKYDLRNIRKRRISVKEIASGIVRFVKSYVM